MIISWDEYFMGMAELSALRSKDPHSQVGACIVNREKKIVGLGYNGFPKGCKDTEFPWEKNHEDALKSKFTYVVHAEANAIISASREKMIGSTLYLCGKENETGKYVSKSEPCSMCKRMIINAGISTVIVRDDKENYRVIEVENWINNDDSLNGEDSY